MADKIGNKFLKGAAVLAIAGILMKFLGAVFRIPLTNMIGTDGMSYYGVAYSIYGALVVLATAGIPVAISRLVSENIAVNQYRNAHRVFRVSLLMMTGIGLVTFLICFFGAEMIASLVKNPEAALAVRAMAPALLIVPMFSTFRGYFNGRQNMNPTAISELTEQLVRCGVGLYLAYLFYKTNLIYAAAGASFGASAGALGGLAIIFLIYLMNRRVFMVKIERGSQEIESQKSLAKQILIIAIPIILGCEIMPIMTLVDTGIVMRVLQDTGWSYAEAKDLYGLFSGFCNALIAFPQMFTQAVAVSLVPAVSAQFKLRYMPGVHNTIVLGKRTTMIMAFPCAFGIFVLAEPILKLLYFAQPEACHEAAPILMVMAISIIFLADMQTSTSILQSVGKQMVPVRNLAIGCIFKVIATYILVGIHSVNVMGAAIGTMIAYVIAMFLNAAAVRKYTGAGGSFKIFEKTYIRPMIAAALMAGWAFMIFHVLMKLMAGSGHSEIALSGLCTIIAILTAMVVYAILIFLVRAITIEELEQVPIGRKLARIIRKVMRNV